MLFSPAATGDLVGLGPQTKHQDSTNLNMNQYNSVKFLSNFQAFLHKRKASLMKTFWRRFCFDKLYFQRTTPTTVYGWAIGQITGRITCLELGQNV